MGRARSLLRLLPFVASFAACASFGTSSDGPPVAPVAETGPRPPGVEPDVGALPSDARPDAPRPPGDTDAEPRDARTPDAAPLADAEPDTARPVAKKFVFVTAAAFPGTFAAVDALPSIDQADARCAANAGALPGVWAAYLSTVTVSALSRLPDGTEWYLPTPSMALGARVFASRAAVPLGPETPIAVTAAGVALDPAFAAPVWTGTLSTGSVDPVNTCADWRLSATGRVGDAFASTVPAWSTGGAVNCDKDARLYCFQL